MKKFLLTIITLLWIMNMCLAQVSPQPPQKMTDIELGHFYNDKAKKQKTTAFILLGVGFAGWMGGALMMESSVWDDSDGSYEAGTAVMLVGFGCTVASVPVFINSAKNKGRAEILLRYENVPVGYLPKTPAQYPAVGIRMSIGK